MKSKQGIVMNFIIITVLFYFFCSCGSEAPSVVLSDTEKLAQLETQTPSHKLDTSVGYCFQIGQKEFLEAFELKIIGNRIKGEGYRLMVPLQLSYRLSIDGVLEGNTAYVNITAINERQEGSAFVKTETWELGEKQLTVKNRELEALVGDFTFERINCQYEKNKDTTRFDSYSGFFEGYSVVSKNGLLGLVNEKWELTIPLKYRDLGAVNEGSIVYYDLDEARRGLLDVNGNILVPAKYPEIMAFNEGLAAFLSDEGKWGFMNRDLEVVIEPQYTNINFYQPDPSRHAFNEGLANVQGANGLWNFINTKGEVVIKGDYLFTEWFKDGKARVYKDNKWFFINKSGKCIQDCDE